MPSSTEHRDRKGAPRLKLAREQAGLTAGRAAHRLGWVRAELIDIEQGRRPVLPEELLLFADLYGVTATWLQHEESELPSDAEREIMMAARGFGRVDNSEVASLIQLLRSQRSR